MVRDGFGPWSHEFVVQDDVSEDCLYLNVWVPADRHVDACPVLVWIHGGAFCQGSGSVPIYDGAALAAQGVVVVTLNYRLGVLGFLAHPDLTQESPTCASGNFGLQDQLAALRWVQANIGSLGGDPDAVTIAGQSAGALSVHMLTVSPLASGLFHRAIALSGPPTLVPILQRAQAEVEGTEFAAELHCNDVQSLRALSVEDLTRHLSPGPRFMPMVDGCLLPVWPPQSSQLAVANPVAMLVGQTGDENSGLDPHHGHADAAVLTAGLRRLHDGRASELAAAYLAASAGDSTAAYRSASSDLWRAALWHWAEHRARTVQLPTYAYLFEQVPPGEDPPRWGAFHTADVPYLLGNLEAAPQRQFTRADRDLGALLAGYCLSFIRTGDPNGEGRPPWPTLDPDNPRWMRLGAEVGATNMFSALGRLSAEAMLHRTPAVTVLP